SQFNDPGMNNLYVKVMETVAKRTGAPLAPKLEKGPDPRGKIYVIPPARSRYLAEIAEANRAYDAQAEGQAELAQTLYGIFLALASSLDLDPREAESKLLGPHGLREGEIDIGPGPQGPTELSGLLVKEFDRYKKQLLPQHWETILDWGKKTARYRAEGYSFTVRDREIGIKTHTESLSHSRIPKVVLPKYRGWGDILRWTLQENVPGEFPYTAGLYPFKREGEDPTRMFAGEGGPERTNRRFHYVSLGMPAKRLSTAFDSVTLYGNDPHHRPDIYGKIGNAGVSICCLDDAKKLYSGFDLSDPMCSVSMTINGPAPMILAFFMNAAIDQNCEKYIRENGLEREVHEKMEAIFKEKGVDPPAYYGALPEGNQGLGLMLLGVSG